MKWMFGVLMLTMLAGCAEEPAADPEVQVVDTPEELPPRAGPTYYNRTGSLTSVGPAVETVEIPFAVPFGTARVDASVASSNQAVTFEILLPREMGQVESSVNGQTATASVVAPEPGEYTAVVRSDVALPVAEFVASIVVSPDASIRALLSETVVIPPGQIFEVNLQMQLYDELHWEWTSSSVSDYNVHTHFDGEVQYLVETSGTSGEGNITAARTGGHSFMWDNPQNAPQSVTYRAWGTFQVDSYFPPR